MTDPSKTNLTAQHNQIDERFAKWAALTLNHMRIENSGWLRYFRRWKITDEPLRNDAQALLNEYNIKDVEVTKNGVKIIYRDRAE